MSDHEGFELKMPFVNVASIGGIYDDETYAAGFEIGRFYADMNHRPLNLLDRFQLRAANMAQADLIAMDRGYRIIDREATDGWTTFRVEVES